MCVERVKAFVPSIEVEKAVEGDGDRNGDDGNMGNMTSSGNVDSK